jgi:quercetin dioxygenase-like cupin family protein
MKLYRFDAQAGKIISQYDSVNLVMSRIVRTSAAAHIGCMHLDANGVVGYHQAVSPQLFLVVQGEGWVRGEDEWRIAVKAGQAAFWQTGEWHESGTDTGMTAIVIESAELDPASFMPELDEPKK